MNAVGRKPSVRAAGFLLAVGVVMLVSIAYDGARMTRSLLRETQIDGVDNARNSYDCLTQRFERVVPPGARVLLRADAQYEETFQRIIESTYPRYDFVERRKDAEFVVRAIGTPSCVTQIRIVRVP